MIIALGACQESRIVTPREPESVAASVIPCDQQFIPEPGCEDPGGPQGSGINPNDSHVSANVVQTYTTVIVDPATGLADTMPSAPIPYRLEAGYSIATGADIVQHTYQPDEADDGVSTIRITGASAEELDASGSPAAPADGDVTGEIVNPLSGMPDLGMFPSVIDAIVSGETGAFRVAAIANRMIALNTVSITMQSGVSARFVDDTHLDFSVADTKTAGRGRRGSVDARFARQPDGGWVLRRMDQVTEVESGGKRAALRSRTEIRGLRVVRNRQADRQRESKRATRFERWRDATRTPAGAEAPPANLSVVPINWSSTGIITWNPPGPLPFPFVPPTTPASFSPTNWDRTAEEASGCDNATFAAANAVPVSGGDRIVFQHGFISGSCTSSFLAPKFPSCAGGGRVIGRTSWPASYESQADALHGQILAGSSDWIFVGHSNGGIVNRYLAQTRSPGFAKSVITINSPHSGAAGFGNVAGFVNRLAPLMLAYQTIYHRRSLGFVQAAVLLSDRGLIRSIANQAHASVIGQMVSNSPFLTGLAARPEGHVRRFAIRSDVSRMWQSVRVICDMWAPVREGVPAGQRCVRDTYRTVKRVGIQSAVVGLLAIASAAVPYINALSPQLAYAAIGSATALALMFAIDVVWQGTMTSFAASDGVVTIASQRWPGANDERVIPSADSHTGSTKSEKVRRALEELLPGAR